MRQRAFRESRATIALTLLIEATTIEKTLSDHGVKELPPPVAENRAPYTPPYPWEEIKAQIVQREPAPVGKGKSSIGQKRMPEAQALFNF
jgi:hypothetical protein